MQFKRLHDPFLRVLFENDEIVAIDKPYGISSHTNDAKAGNENYIQHGLIELFENQLGRKLHIVHRLDRTTTGVIVFAKTLEAAAKFQGYFRNRETAKTYVFITASQISQTSLKSNAPILVKGSELEAETSFTRLARGKGYDLWQAHPKTGRNHQIRIHAAGLGIPLLGDTTYGGARYPFICLHNKSIRFPGDLLIESDPPAYFEHLEWLGDEWFTTTLFEVDRRKRAFDAGAAPLHLAPGLDTYRDVTTATEMPASSVERIAKQLKQNLIVYQKDQWVRIEKKEWTIKENGLTYELRAGVGASLGLPIDQRLQRNWIRENSRSRDVLNLFAANSTSSVAAHAGGAKTTTAVESKKSAIEWGRKNFELNKLPGAEPKLLLRDPLTFISQSVTKASRYDLIICDVPSFFRREKGVFKVETDLSSLLTDCLKCLSENGELLFSTTSTSLKVGDIRSLIEAAARSAKVGTVEITYLLPSLDIALPGETPVLKSFLVKRVGK